MENKGNPVTKVVEKIMTDYGGTKYKNVGLADFKSDIVARFQACSAECHGPMKAVCTRTINKIQKGKTVADILMELNEVLFGFFEKSEKKIHKEEREAYEKTRH